MKAASRRNLAIGATGLVVLAGAAGAVAATDGSGGAARQAYVNDVAKRLNVTPSALTSAMQAALNDRIDAAVAAGRLTQARANALKARVARSGAMPWFGPGLGGHRRGLAGGVGAAAGYLGVSRAALRADLQSGKSLAQIASSTPGKSVTGLKAAITTAVQGKLSAALAAGRITAPQEQQILANLPARIDRLVQRSGLGVAAGRRGIGPG